MFCHLYNGVAHIVMHDKKMVSHEVKGGGARCIDSCLFEELPK